MPTSTLCWWIWISDERWSVATRTLRRLLLGRFRGCSIVASRPCGMPEGQTWASLRLRTAPGHTPGSSVLWLDGPAKAVFVGDITHTPLQILRPDDQCAFDLDF